MRREEDEGGGEGEDMAESRVGEEMISRCVCVCVCVLGGWLVGKHTSMSLHPDGEGEV